ncbi:MAG: hypothetical protein KTR22_14950, partial [Flavobacteriaceae bacterium]|nr:hypothetical protein [Flavobacteriaceae bacterium]
NDNSRVLMGRLNPVESFSGQMKFITFNLKDSLVSKIQFLSKSSKVEYEESDFKYSDISRYQISISTFDFAVASQVFGTYKLVLDEEFGYFDNDTIVKGTFKCINSRIQKFKEIQEWNIPEWNKKKKEKWGIQLNK